MKIYCLGGEVEPYASQFVTKIALLDPTECDGQCKIGENQTLTNKWLYDCNQKTEKRLVGAYVPSDGKGGDKGVVEITREGGSDVVKWQRRQWEVRTQPHLGAATADTKDRILGWAM